MTQCDVSSSSIGRLFGHPSTSRATHVSYQATALNLITIGIYLLVLCSNCLANDRPPLRWPDWAKRTYVGIQDARDQQTHELKVLQEKNLNLEDVRKYVEGETSSNMTPIVKEFLTWKERTPLYQLDTEVDMLAGALLALERPDVVIELYQRWYDEDAVEKCLERLPAPKPESFQSADAAQEPKAAPPDSEAIWNNFYTGTVPTFAHFRTPAAILFFSRAHRDRAIKALETPGLEVDRLKAFEDANRDMAIAFQWLQLSRTQITELSFTVDNEVIKWRNDKLPAEESFAYWIRNGLPRPHSLYSWAVRRKSEEKVVGVLFDGDPKGMPTNRDNSGTESMKDPFGIEVSRVFPAFQALDFAVKYFEWEARIKRELGDMAYRVTGGTGKPKGASRESGGSASDSSPTAAGYYLEARDVLYLARMIAPTNRQLHYDAREIDARIGWMQNNLPYGGQDFYQFQPHSPSNYFTVWQQRLRSQVESMAGDLRELRTQREKAAAWVNQIQEGDRNADMLKQQFNFQMNFAIREKMADIKFNLVNLATERANSALQNLQDESQTFLAESSLQIDSLVYQQEIARVKDQIVDDALTRIGEIRRSGALQAFRGSFFPASGNNGRQSSSLVDAVGYQRLYVTEEERREDLALVQGMVSNDRRLRLSFGKIEVGNSILPTVANDTALTSSDFAPGIIEEKESLWQVAALELQIARGRLQNYNNVLELNSLKADESIFEKTAEDIQQQIKQYSSDYELNQEKEEQNTRAKIQTSILDRAKREVDRAKDHVKRTEGNIRKFRDHIARTQQTIKKIRDWGERAEQAYDMFRTITVAVSDTPATIAGPMGGPIVDPAGSFERKGRAALERIQAVYQNLVQSQSFDELLQKLDKEAASMESDLASLRSDADNRVSELETAVQQSNLSFVLAVPEAEIFQNLKAKVEAIKQDHVQELETALDTIHGNFKNEVSGTLFEQRGTHLSDQAADKAKAEIKSLDQKVQTQIDQAFEHTRVRFVAAIEAIESWRGEVRKTTGDDKAGSVYAEYMLQKAEAEKRLAESRIRQSVITSERRGVEKAISEAERNELKALVEVAEQRESSTRAAMVSAIIDQETAWLRLVHTAIRWNRANDQAAELSSQIENIKIAADRLRGERETAEISKNKAEVEQSQAMEEQVSRIEQLAGELKQLNSPEGRIVTADMLDRIAPALIAMEGTSEAQQRMRDGLDKANNLLVEYARWLYLLSGQPDCRLYATRCDSYGDLVLSCEGLDRIAKETLDHAGLTRAGVFRVRIPIASLSIASPGKSNSEERTESTFLRLTASAISPIPSEYFHVCRSPLGMEIRETTNPDFDNGAILELPSFVLPTDSHRVEVGETQLPMLLCGYLPTVRMKDEHRLLVRSVTAVLHPAAGAASGLRHPLQVPFKYGFKILSSAIRQRTSLTQNAETITGFLETERRKGEEGISLIQSPPILPNYEYFGRSVYGGYRLELRGKAQDLEKIEHVDVYFYYLTPGTTSLSVASKQSGTTSIAKRISLGELGLSAATKQEEKARQPADTNQPTDDFEAAWIFNATADDASSPAHKRFLDELKQLEQKDFLQEFDEENMAITNYITGTETDPTPSSLNRPIALRKSLQTCNVLLHLLSEDVRKRAELPLESAADVTCKYVTPNRLALSSINTLVTDHNLRFQHLQQHVDKLSVIDGVMNGVAINQEQPTLTTLERLLFHPKHMETCVLAQLVSFLSLSADDDLELLKHCTDLIKRRVQASVNRP